MTWDDWFIKRMRSLGPWYYETEEMIREMERMFEENMKELEKNVPKELVREQKLPDGTIRKEWGPFIYGYSMTIGPDGKPVVREFGNVKPSFVAGGKLSLKDGREPLVDVISTNGEIKVIAEVPGVNKQDIKIVAAEDSISIQADTPERKYRKEIDLPLAVEPDSAKSVYKNGILEITFKRKEKERSGVSIKVD